MEFLAAGGRAMMNKQRTKKWWNSANYWVSNDKPKCTECLGHGKVRTDRARGYVGLCPTCHGRGNDLTARESDES